MSFPNPIDLFTTTVGPIADTAEAGRKIADLETRVLAIEEALGIKGDSASIGASRITIKAQDTLSLETPTGKVKISPTGILIESSGGVNVTSSSFVVSSGVASFNTASANFSGLVKSDTVVTNTIIAAVYTPGAGNIF